MTLAIDKELARAAISGEVSGVSTILGLHAASMRAVALGILGHRPEAEDAVQDAMVVALARIGELRDPAAVGPWLRAIVRNSCLMQVRSLRRGRHVLEATADLPATMPSAEELLERSALKEWTAHAIGRLSEPLQMVTLLRYFSDVSSYEDIAACCGVPVGTVRSRLNEAKRKLGEALLETADARHDDARTLSKESEAAAQELLSAAAENAFDCRATSVFALDVEVVGPSQGWGSDLSFLAWAMNEDVADGVRQRVKRVFASRNVALWEMDLLSPPEDPTHCPPGIVWLHSRSGGLTRRLRLFHAPRERNLASTNDRT
jgi:RNA polymerase sigma factor (sigma-70 family)